MGADRLNPSAVFRMLEQRMASIPHEPGIFFTYLHLPSALSFHQMQNTEASRRTGKREEIGLGSAWCRADTSNRPDLTLLRKTESRALTNLPFVYPATGILSSIRFSAVPWPMGATSGEGVQPVQEQMVQEEPFRRNMIRKCTLLVFGCP
jgi:hypothetical protein